MNLDQFADGLKTAVKHDLDPATLGPVDPISLHRLRDFMLEIIGRSPPPPEGGCIGIDLKSLAPEFPDLEFPDADPLSLLYRCGALGVLEKEGALRQWQHGAEFDDMVYRVIAALPMSHNFDCEAVRAAIQAAESASST